MRDIKGTIGALLSKAEESSNSNAHEREAALKKVDELLEKYNLSLFDIVDQETEGFFDSNISETRWTPNDQVKLRKDRLVNKIVGLVCKLVGTDFFYYTGINTVVIVGSDELRETTINLAQWLFDAMEKECKQAAKVYRKEHGNTNGFTVWFKNGFYWGLSEQIDNIIAARNESYSTALVPMQTAVQKYMDKKTFKVDRGRSAAPRSYNKSAYANGFFSGSTVQIQERLGKNEQ